MPFFTLTSFSSDDLPSNYSLHYHSFTLPSKIFSLKRPTFTWVSRLIEISPEFRPLQQSPLRIIGISQHPILENKILPISQLVPQIVPDFLKKHQKLFFNTIHTNISNSLDMKRLFWLYVQQTCLYYHFKLFLSACITKVHKWFIQIPQAYSQMSSAQPIQTDSDFLHTL